MPLLTVVLVLILIGVLLALVNKYGAEYIDAKFVKLINLVVIVVVILWLVSLFFNMGSLNQVRVGR